jgi:trans-aconitate 2-methyltransferase
VSVSLYDREEAMPWSPEQYHKFQAERFLPFEDLVRLVRVRPDVSAIDLGCGTGELTARLAEALPASDVLGIDSSTEMLARAEGHTRPGLRFAVGDLAAIEGQWDLVFSHAAIHWVDDHERLIPQLFGLVRPGGQLVVQQPSNHTHVSHTLILQVAAEEPFRSALGGWTRRVPVLALERYAALLHGLGGTELTVFEKVYPHVLPDADALAEWTSGTALVPYFERLGSPLRELFLERYRELLRAALPMTPVFYGFRRILFAVSRPAVLVAGR